jgi:hypothetical protein
MTLAAHRDNIEPMFRRVIQIVVVILGLLATFVAFQFAGWQQAPSGNGVSNCIFGLPSLWVLAFVFAFVTVSSFFAILGLPVFAGAPVLRFSSFCGLSIFSIGPVVNLFAGWRLLIGFIGGNMAGFTATPQAIRIFSMFMKLGNRFELLAFRASFCLNCVRHILSFAKSMFKAVCGLRPADGLFYCSNGIMRVNSF